MSWPARLGQCDPRLTVLTSPAAPQAETYTRNAKVALQGPGYKRIQNTQMRNEGRSLGFSRTQWGSFTTFVRDAPLHSLLDHPSPQVLRSHIQSTPPIISHLIQEFRLDLTANLACGLVLILTSSCWCHKLSFSVVYVLACLEHHSTFIYLLRMLRLTFLCQDMRDPK